MKKIYITLLLGLALLISSVSADTWINDFTKSNGAYVQGHNRSSPNSTRNDNYSTKGNQSPYTGSYGTKPRDNGYNSSGNSKRYKSKDF